MKKFITLLAVLAVAAVSCTKETTLQPAGQQTLHSKFIGGTDGETVPGTLLVKLDENAAETLRKGGFTGQTYLHHQ